MRLADLQNKNVVVWGSGREAAAFVNAVHRLELEVAIRVIDEAPTPGAIVSGIPVAAFDEGLLRAADVVVRSPGVSIHRPELQGCQVTTPTDLWFAEPHSRVIAVTRTKGKSTTSSLLAHVFNHLGIRTTLAGNIGRPPLDFVGDPEPDTWVLELSSFQISDLDGAPDIAVLTSLDSDHLDWHLTQENYLRDKLRLFDGARMSVANVVDVGVAAVVDRWANVIKVDDSITVPKSKLFGNHNDQLIRLVLQVLEVCGVDLDARKSEIAAAVGSFEPLPHRLEPVIERDGVLYINDSLSTNPIASMAAVKAFIGRPISLLLGGYDRGLTFDEYGAFLSTVPDLRVFSMPACGDRITATFTSDVPVIKTENLPDAVTKAAGMTKSGGVVLLSPAAASFGEFHNYAERGEAFKQLVLALPR